VDVPSWFAGEGRCAVVVRDRARCQRRCAVLVRGGRNRNPPPGILARGRRVLDALITHVGRAMAPPGAAPALEPTREGPECSVQVRSDRATPVYVPVSVTVAPGIARFMEPESTQRQV